MTAAQLHGQVRAASGLTIEQLVAEYRVLRSSVLRMWSEASTPDEFAAQDTMRFNEAVDQAVAESVAFFSAEIEQWHAVLLGVVGHDLRGPLNAVLLTSEVLMREVADTPLATYVESIGRSGRRIGTLLDSLLEYNKASLGTEMVLHRTPGDVVEALHDELALLRTSLPGREISFRAPARCQADLDFSRVREALANLVYNAAQHGLPGSPIEVVLEQAPGKIILAVANEAEAMASTTLQRLFEPPLGRRMLEGSRRETRNLGLGLFIVRTIARAHGGDAGAHMRDRKVTFEMTLPTASR
jgi:signal transduction histidine kinase